MMQKMTGNLAVLLHPTTMLLLSFLSGVQIRLRILACHPRNGADCPSAPLSPRRLDLDTLFGS